MVIGTSGGGALAFGPKGALVSVLSGCLFQAIERPTRARLSVFATLFVLPCARLPPLGQYSHSRACLPVAVDEGHGRMVKMELTKGR